MAAAADAADWRPVGRRGRIAPSLSEEFPGLGLAWVEVEVEPGRSPEPVRRRLAHLSDRFYGAEAIRMRERPVPWAYRVFFRQVGLDPDRTRTPIEQLGLERLEDGAFKSRGMPADALRIAIIETGVALRGFDADALRGPLSLRQAGGGEEAPGLGALSAGTLVLADDDGPVGLLFGETASGREMSAATRRCAIVAVQVGAVPAVAVEEALWIAASTLEGT